MFRKPLVVVSAVLALTACGSDGPDGPSDQEVREAEGFCGDSLDMGIDEYENPDAFDRCVQDVIPVLDCLGPAREAVTPWVPRDCDNGGYNP